MKRFMLCALACLAAAGLPSTCLGADAALAGGAAGFAQLKLVPMNEVTAQLECGSDAATITFDKTGEVRRLLALEVKPASLAPAKTLSLKCQLKLDTGQAPRPAVVLFERGGGVWFKVHGAADALAEGGEVRVPMRSLREAGFSADDNAELNWDQVDKVWFGLVIDGPAKGSFELTSACLTDEPYKPTKPVRLTGKGPGRWSVSKQKDVTATLTTPNEGPDGKPCMKVEFNIPGGQHRWMVPATRIVDAELEGYRALRFTYKAALPAGIKGLLVMLGETGGGSYVAPAPKPSADWTTITVPFDQLELASWTKDKNGKLDIGNLRTVNIGAHGTPSGAGGPGTIWVADVEFVP